MIHVLVKHDIEGRKNFTYNRLNEDIDNTQCRTMRKNEKLIADVYLKNIQ